MLYSPLENWLGWRLGLQWALAVIALTAALGFTAVVRAVRPGRWPLSFLGFPLALTWKLYMGFFPFAVGSALGLFVLALAIQWRHPNNLHRVVIGFLLLLQAVCHVFSAVLAGAVVASLLLMRAPSGTKVREALRIALMGAPASAILVASAIGIARDPGPSFERRLLVLPLRLTLASLPRVIAPGPWWRAAIAILLLVTALAIGLRRAWRCETSSTDRALIVSGLAFLLLGIFCPINIPGWQFFSQRFIPLGVALSLISLPVETLRRPRVAVALGAGTFLLSALWLTASGPFHRRLAAACDDAILGLSAPVKRGGIWLPVELTRKVASPLTPRRARSRS